MKKFFAFVILSSLMTCAAHGEIFEASGRGRVPAFSETLSQGKILARRGAIVDLQRNLLLKASMNYSASGIIRGIIITSETWDGNIYTVTGYIKK